MVRKSLRGGNARNLAPEVLSGAFAGTEPTEEVLAAAASEALQGVGVEPEAAQAQAAVLAPAMLVEERRTRSTAAADGAPGEGAAAATEEPEGGSAKKTLKVLETAAALQSKRPLSSIKDRSKLLAAAKTKAKMLTQALHALKVKVQQADAADNRALDARSVIADQRRYVQELEQQLAQLQPMVEDLQQQLAVFDEAAVLLVNAGLRDFPYEFASAVVDGDLHEACRLLGGALHLAPRLALSPRTPTRARAAHLPECHCAADRWADRLQAAASSVPRRLRKDRVPRAHKVQPGEPI